MCCISSAFGLRSRHCTGTNSLVLEPIPNPWNVLGYAISKCSVQHCLKRSEDVWKAFMSCWIRVGKRKDCRGKIWDRAGISRWEHAIASVLYSTCAYMDTMLCAALFQGVNIPLLFWGVYVSNNFLKLWISCNHDIMFQCFPLQGILFVSLKCKLYALYRASF